MAKKLPPPSDEELDRIAEAIDNLDVKGEILNPAEFNTFYDDYFDNDDYFLLTERLRKGIYQKVREKHPIRPVDVKGRKVQVYMPDWDDFIDDQTKFKP